MTTPTENRNPSPEKNVALDQWLRAVSSHLATRRSDVSPTRRPKRNRERERARREARQLFAQYYQDLAVASASHALAA